MTIAKPRSSWTTFKPSFAVGPHLVKRVFIHHTAFPDGGGVISGESERARMRSIEASHLARGWAAIGYSKVVFGSGRAYDGRGWGNKQGGNFDGGTNESSYSVAFDGDFSTKSPTDAAFATAAALIAEGLDLGWVADDYELWRHGMEIVPPGVPGKEHCAGKTVLACTGKDCPGKGVYEHFDRLREEPMDPKYQKLLDALLTMPQKDGSGTALPEYIGRRIVASTLAVEADPPKVGTAALAGLRAEYDAHPHRTAAGKLTGPPEKL